MIYGIIAAEKENAPPLPPSPPAGAIGSADFINGIYIFNDVVTDISDFIDETTGLIDATGINLVATEPVVNIIGALRTKLITFDWTLVLELEANVSTGNTVFFNIYSEYGANGYTNQVWAEAWGVWEFDDENADVGEVYGSGTPMERYISDDYHLTDGIHKIAYTRTDNRISFSVDGNTIQTDTSNIFPINWGSNQGVVFGGWAGGTISKSFKIRSIAIYDPQADADLPSLSA